ncbi:MAG: uracil-DNA glycosylase family protein [Gaiellales bacterium]
MTATIEFDPGYGTEPWATLCRSYPGDDVYPPGRFRTEWGPIFHRGRLDGSARVLVIGQDPAQHEEVARRILIGEAGQRAQGFLAKLGITRSYVMVNTYLYSVYGSGTDSSDITGYRNQWLTAIRERNDLEAIVTLGGLADRAYHHWLEGAPDGTSDIPYQHITHPTYPESGSHSGVGTYATLVTQLLENWNGALQALHPGIAHPDTPTDLVLYGDAFLPTDDVEIPAADLPPGIPEWMRGLQAWADRTGTDADTKRATITVTVPSAARAWETPA